MRIVEGIYIIPPLWHLNPTWEVQKRKTMPVLNLTVADMLKGSPITPGWYKCAVSKVEVKPSKDGGSLNFITTFKLEDKNGTEIENFFNSKAPGMMTPFIAASTNKTMQEMVDGGALQVNTDDWMSYKLQVQVKNEPWEGRLTNKIGGYLAYNATIPF